MTDSSLDAASGSTDAAADEADEQQKASAPTRVVLVRHGVTEHTGPILSGRLPGIDLSERGVAQAQATAERLAALHVSAIYSSPIERTAQTAQHIADRAGLEVRLLPGVIEADYGEWTGGKIADLAKTDAWKVVQVAPSRAVFPGGETLRDMQARTVAALEGVVSAHPNETVVVVSHADPIRSAIAHFTGMHLDLFQRLDIAPASITVLQFSPFGAHLLKYSDTGTLDELVPPPASGGDAHEAG